MRKWIRFVFCVFVMAVALRYLVPGRLGRFGLAVRSHGVEPAVPGNLLAFWLVLVAGGIVILVKLIGRAHK